MKRSIEGSNQFSTEEANAKLKQKNLLNEFLALQKEIVSKKRKLQAAKQRRDNILGEILFLKERRRYLLKTQASNGDSERNISHMKILDTESEVAEEERFNSGYDIAVEAARRTFTSKFNSGYEIGDEEVVAGGSELILECVPKTCVIDDNGVGKKKHSWHGQLTLKV